LSNKKRVQVTFSERQWALLNRLRGEMGDTDADVVRNILLAWLAEKSFVSDTVKRRGLTSPGTRGTNADRGTRR
jgi:hypothetical protein